MINNSRKKFIDEQDGEENDDGELEYDEYEEDENENLNLDDDNEIEEEYNRQMYLQGIKKTATKNITLM